MNSEPASVATPAQPMGSFESLVELYASPLRRYFLRRTRDDHWVENLVQETFLRIHRYIASLRTDGPQGGWVFTIARNLWWDRLEQLKRDPVNCTASATLEAVSGPTERQPEVVALEREVERALSAAVADLPPRYQDVFLMKHQSGLSYVEIGQRLGIPEGTAKSRLHEAVRRLSERLRREGFLSTAGGTR